jgi:hypothetical protein
MLAPSMKHLVDGCAFRLGERQNFVPHGIVGFWSSKALVGELFPGSRQRFLHDELYRLGGVLDRIGVLLQGRLIAFDDCSMIRAMVSPGRSEPRDAVATTKRAG